MPEKVSSDNAVTNWLASEPARREAANKTAGAVTMSYSPVACEQYSFHLHSWLL